MASSAALTTTHLPRLRQELEEWRAKQPPSQPFSKPLESIETRLDEDKYNKEHGKDVIVAFRTRPPLEHEAEQKFNANIDDSKQEHPDDNAVQKEELEFCSGISVGNADPGVFVAHVPGMKVRLIPIDVSSILIDYVRSGQAQLSRTRSSIPTSRLGLTYPTMKSINEL